MLAFKTGDWFGRRSVGLMLGLRKVLTVVVSAWGCAILANLALVWALGLDGLWAVVAVVVAAVGGGLLGLGEARELKPMPPAERRDAILGWGAVVGAVAALACLLLPMPGGALAATAVLVATGLLLWRFAASQPLDAPSTGRSHCREPDDPHDGHERIT